MDLLDIRQRIDHKTFDIARLGPIVLGLFEVIHLTHHTSHDNTDDDKEWCALTDALERGAEGEKPAAMCAALTHIYSSAYSVRIALKNAEWGLRTLGGVPLRPWILLECGAFANMVAAGTVRDTSRISRWLLDSIFPSVKSPQMVHLRAVFSLVMAERAPVTATTCPETLHMDISLLENTRHVFNRTICAGVVTHIIHGMCAAHPNVPADAILRRLREGSCPHEVHRRPLHGIGRDPQTRQAADG